MSADRQTTAIMETPVFLGCWGGVGHYTWRPDGSRTYGTPEGCPWSNLDDEANTPRRSGHGCAVLEHRQGLTLLGVHDFSIDSRPGSRAVFVLPGSLTADEAIKAAGYAFPSVVDRIGKIVVEEDRTPRSNGRSKDAGCTICGYDRAAHPVRLHGEQPHDFPLDSGSTGETS